jgi:putative ABC transport system permease protein
MLHAHLIIAFRNVGKHKLFSAINIFGLAAALSVCFLAIAHIKGIYDFDTIHRKRNRIYRILTQVTTPENRQSDWATSPLPLAGELKKNYAFVEATSRLVRTSGDLMTNDSQLTSLVYAVDADFFHLFSYRFDKGHPPLKPGTIVLTHKAAQRYFGQLDPLGKTLNHRQFGPLIVTGILADLPPNSHLSFDALISLSNLASLRPAVAYWGWQQFQNGYTYVLLKPNARATNLQTVLPAMSRLASQALHGATARRYSFRLQPLTQIAPARQFLKLALHEPHYGELLAEVGVGLIILLLAGFNYVNLTLARSLGRAREVAVRKVVGAQRWQLMTQFITESIVFSFIALGLAVGMTQLIRPMTAVQQWFMGSLAWDNRLWLILVVFTLLTGFVAGLLPARILSSFQPSQAFRTQQPRFLLGISFGGNQLFRKSLIVIQFAVSLIALVVVLSLSRQFRYMATGEYGFRRKQVLIIPLTDQSVPRLVNELNQLVGVEQVTASSDLLGLSGGLQRQIRRQRGNADSAAASVIAVDANFLPTMGLTLLTGHNLVAVDSMGFSPSGQSSGANSSTPFVLINEQAVKALGLGDPGGAVGQSLWLTQEQSVRVAGVLKNFHFGAFALPIKPLILINQSSQFRYMQVAISLRADHAILARVRRIWSRLYPYQPFSSQWYDDSLRQLYDRRTDLQLTGLLIGMALSIACLGLLGIVTYNTEIRTKEVGIRKVMGASVGQVIGLLSWDFIKLLLLAAGLGLPLGYLAGSFLLQNFAYHIRIGLDSLGLCLLVLVILGGLTIGWRTYRASLSNPVDSLRVD